MNGDACTIALARFISEMEQSARSMHDSEDRPLYGRFLAATAILLAKVDEGIPIGDDVATMERLFG